MALPATHLPVDDARLPRRGPLLAYAGGPPSRRGTSALHNGVLGMAIFLGTETMLFAGLISAFLILRAGSVLWPPAGQPRLPVVITGLNTLVLLASAFTMRRAAAAARRHDRIRWLGLTGALGATFLLVQGTEWARLLQFGLRASSSLYGATFYTLIGCHALHVLAAVTALLVLLGRVVRARSEVRAADLEVCQLYWFFVVGVWPVLYVLVYLG